jgi:hypothetical protein
LEESAIPPSEGVTNTGSRLGKCCGFGVAPKVNLEELARELGCMEPWETLEKG